jgi:hypothetical protein
VCEVSVRFDNLSKQLAQLAAEARSAPERYPLNFHNLVDLYALEASNGCRQLEHAVGALGGLKKVSPANHRSKRKGKTNQQKDGTG